MRTLPSLALSIVIFLGTMAMLTIRGRSLKTGALSEVRLASDGAFRDGVYLGKLAAKGGQALRPAIGRWSTDLDRSSFTAGYRSGYSEFLASARPSVRIPSTE
ncbi:MAG: hypothetical protein WB660_26445 [Candidatus Sulfotelmatobacter sp.]